MSTSFDHIIFDLDGTLADTAPDVLNGVNHALIQFGYPLISLDQMKQAIGPGKDEFIRHIFPDGEEPNIAEFLKAFRKHYWDHCLDQTRLFPGMSDVLTTFKNRKLAVASNKPKIFIKRILRGLGVLDLFTEVIGPEDVVNAKPDPEMITKIINLFNGKPSQTLMIGDTDKDMQAGRSAGVRLCGVRYGYGVTRDLELQKPDFLIDRPIELLDVIGNHQH